MVKKKMFFVPSRNYWQIFREKDENWLKYETSNLRLEFMENLLKIFRFSPFLSEIPMPLRPSIRILFLAKCSLGGFLELVTNFCLVFHLFHLF